MINFDGRRLTVGRCAAVADFFSGGRLSALFTNNGR